MHISQLVISYDLKWTRRQVGLVFAGVQDQLNIHANIQVSRAVSSEKIN